MTVEVRSPAAGTVKAIHVEEGATVEVGGKFFTLAVGEGEPPAAPPADTPAAVVETPKPAAAAAPPPKPPKPAAAAAPPAASRAAPESLAPRERRVAMTRMRKRIAQRLKDAQNEAAMLTTFNEVDMTNLSTLRKKYQDVFVKKHGTKLGFMGPFVAAASKALQEQPAVNAVIDGSDVVYRDYVDISVAVSSPSGNRVSTLTYPCCLHFTLPGHTPRPHSLSHSQATLPLTLPGHTPRSHSLSHFLSHSLLHSLSPSLSHSPSVPI